MPPKKPNRANGLLKFFAKHQEERRNKENEEMEESCQVIFQNEPSTSTSTASNVPTKWGSFIQQNQTILPDKSGKDWQNPCLIPVARKSMEQNGKAELLKNGFDEIQANGIYYPVDEFVRKFETSLVRCCLGSNCCIAVPSTAPSSAAKIVSIVSFNFLKWFPRSYVMLISSSQQQADKWVKDVRKIGIEANQITKIPNLTAFKSLKGDVGRVLVFNSPACAAKVMETEEAKGFIEDIRLVFIDLKINECCNKFKPILAALTVADTFFRCIVLTTSVLNTSRRTAVITKRQQTITNLQLSDWIEQSETDFAFRCSNIPAGCELKYWKDEDLEPEHLEILQEFENSISLTMSNLSKKSIVPSSDVQKLIWIDWQAIKAVTEAENVRIELEKAEFLTRIFKFLKFDGVSQAGRYLEEKLKNQYNKSIEEIIKGNEKLGCVVRKMEKGGKISHGKYKSLVETINTFVKMENRFGVIFARNSENSKDVHEYLAKIYGKELKISRIVIGRAGNEGEWPMERISTVFHDSIGTFNTQKIPKIVIIPLNLGASMPFIDGLQLAVVSFVICLDRESVFNLKKYHGPYLILLHEKLERLREDDGRIIVEDGVVGNEPKKQKIGALERYEFKFESSRLRLNTAKMPLNFYVPEICGIDERIKQIGRARVEISSKEHMELVQRMKITDFGEFRKKKRQKLMVLVDENMKDYDGFMDDEMVFWNRDLQYLGDVPSSQLSRRFVEYLGDSEVVRKAKIKKRFQYVNEVSCTTKLQFIDNVLKNLDRISLI